MQKHKEHTIFWIGQIFLICFIVTSCQLLSFTSAYCQAQKRVLVLHSYNVGFPWTDSIQRGIIDELGEMEVVELYIEYMDTKRTPQELLFSYLASIYAQKYNNIGIDVILTTDDNAFNFALGTRSVLFPGAPIVFCGVNNFSHERLQGNSDITGVVENVDFLGGTELLLKLFPNTKTIAVISNETPTDDLYKEQYEQEVIVALAEQVQFKKLYRLPAGQLRLELASLPKDSAVFNLTFWRDPTVRSFYSKESNRLVAEASPVPVFTAWDHTLSDGILGGLATSSYKQGKTAGQMVKRILNGESAEDIDIIEDSPNVPMFDFTVMQRFHLAKGDLPANSIVLNEPESFYYKYKYIVWLTLVFILLQMGAILLLLRNIARRRKIQKDLEESEERYRRLAENSPDMIYRMTLPEGKYEYVSSASDSIFGYPPEIWYQTPILIKKIIHPDSQQYFAEQWEQLTRGILPKNYEYKILHKKKGTRWLFQRNVAVRDTTGRLSAIEGIVTDITKRKRMEKALIQAEAQLRILIDTIPDLVWLKNPEGVFLGCNRAFERFFGAKETEIIGKTDFHFVDKELAEFFRRYDLKAMESAQPSVNEEALVFADDGYRGLFETVKTPMHDADGNLIGVLGVARDITERKNAENALKKNEQRYKSAQRMGNVGNWEYDIAEGKFWGSEQAKSIFGFDPGDQYFSVEEVESCIIERLRVRQSLIDLIEHDKQYDIEYEIVPVKGPSKKTLRSVAEIHRDDHGSPQKVIGVVQDITQQKRAEAEKLELERQLRQSHKMEAIGTLAGGIAHDFNNVLGAILGYAEMAREECSPGSTIAQDLDQVIQGSLRAKDLVRQILAFSRQSKAQRIPLQPANIVKETISLLRSSLPATINIEQETASGGHLIFVDPVQIHQILLNLSTNAMHAMEDTGGTLTISQSEKEFTQEDLVGYPYCKPGKYLQLSVADTGPGVSPEIIERIFDPYFTTKSTGKGTGMGLAIVHGIVKSYNGFISCQNRPNSGTVFNIHLPVMKQEKISEITVDNTIPTGTERILYIDDEQMLVDMAKIMLSRLGYDVTVHTRSQDAYTAFKEQPEAFDLVITDQTMPDITGVELAKKMLKVRPQIPIILCTGFSTTVSKETARLLGIKGFAIKPLIRKELALLIREVLDGGTGS